MPTYYGNKNYSDEKEFVIRYSSINNGLSLRLNVDVTSFRKEKTKHANREEEQTKKRAFQEARMCYRLVEFQGRTK